MAANASYSEKERKREISSISSTPVKANSSKKFRPELNKEICESIGMDSDSDIPPMGESLSIKALIKFSLLVRIEDTDIQQQVSNNNIIIMMQKFMLIMVEGVATAVDAAVGKVLEQFSSSKGGSNEGFHSALQKQALLAKYDVDKMEHILEESPCDSQELRSQMMKLRRPS